MAPIPGFAALSGWVGSGRLGRAVVLAVAGVGAALLAVALFDAPAHAQTAERAGHLVDPLPGLGPAPVGDPAPRPGTVPAPPPGARVGSTTDRAATTPSAAGRDRTAATDRTTGRDRAASTDRTRTPVLRGRPAALLPTLRGTPPAADGTTGTRPRPAPLVPRIVERILPPRPAPALPAAPADGPRQPPPADAAPAPVTSTPSRPTKPAGPPRPAPPGGAVGPVDAPFARPAPRPDRAALLPGLVGAAENPSRADRALLLPALAGVTDGPLRPLLDRLGKLAGEVLPPLLALPRGVIAPLLPPLLGGDVIVPVFPPGSVPSTAPVPAPSDEPEPPPIGGQAGEASPAKGRPSPPTVHNGGRSEAVGGGWVRAPVDSTTVLACRSQPPRPSADPGSSPGGAPEAPPVAPGEDRATCDSGPRAAAALPPEASGPDRPGRRTLVDAAPTPVKGLSSAVAARPG